MKNTKQDKNNIELTKMVKILMEYQDLALKQCYPGYPFRNSIIIDIDNDKCYQELSPKATTFKEMLKDLKAKCFDYILGCSGNTKGSWYLGNPKLESVNEFTSFDFDNNKLYIDEPLVARFYLAICSAYNEILAKKLHNKIVFAEIDLETELLSVDIFENIEELKASKLYEWFEYLKNEE